jgi:arginine decarboxylase
MQIYLSSGTGTGPTELAAFDAALLDAGVANHNLICLSSVIPPNSVIERTRYVAPPDAYGDRLYVVMARQIEVGRGKSAWAGLGWTQNPTCGQGLFVELHGSERAQVVSDIETTLTTMIENRPLHFGGIDMELAGIACCRQPVCALVVAVFQRECWGDPGQFRRMNYVR